MVLAILAELLALVKYAILAGGAIIALSRAESEVFMFKPGSRLGRNPAGTTTASLPPAGTPVPANELPARGIQLARPAQALVDQPGVMATFSHCVGVEGEKEPVYSYTLPDGTQLNECFVGGFCLGLCDPAGNVVAGLPN